MLNRATWRILIVDDSDDDRADIRRMLLTGSEARFVFSQAVLGRAGVDAVLRDADKMPDCVVLDYHLPDMDARAVLEALQDEDGVAVCPIVVLTGAADPVLGHEVLRAGAQDFIGKDWLTGKGLVRAIENATERWTMARELKKREHALVQRERELRSLADNTPDILTRFDCANRYVFVNAAIERQTGKPAAHFIGRTSLEAGMPPALCTMLEAALRQVFADGQPHAIAFHFDGSSGRSHYTTRLVPERDDNGEIAFVLGVTHDVSDIRRAEITERESAQRLQMALAAGQAGAWAWDIRADVLIWSPENFALFGRDPSLGQPLRAEHDLSVHPDDRSGLQAAIDAALTRHAPELRSEFRVLHPLLGMRWLQSLGKVDFGAGGEPLRMVGINLDITDRKRLEHALRVEDRRKDEFLATLAHELRNPLAALSSGLEILQQAPDGAAGTGGVRDMMARQFRHMVRMVDDLLDVSRISSGKIELKRSRIAVQTVVNHALEASNLLIKAGGHRLDIQMDAAPVWVDGDLTRLAQVLGNLLGNAAKYTPDGGAISLSVQVEDAQAVIRVRDNGAGIPADMLAAVFDMFTQVDDMLHRARGGLGIGLSLVSKLLAMHGGSIVGESSGLGHGSTFTVRLPLAAPVNAAAPATDGDRAGSEAVGPGMHGMDHAPTMAGPMPAWRILVVDDNVDAAEAMAMLLQMNGCETLTVHDGGAALATLPLFRPHATLLDIGLPDMDGYEVARRIRMDGPLEGALLIALTGRGTPEDKRRAMQAGFDFHLTKPVELQAIQALLERALRTPAAAIARLPATAL